MHQLLTRFRFALLSTLLLAILIVGACQQPKSKLSVYGPVVEAVMRSDAGAFRGLNLGENIDTVLKKEQGEPMEVDETYLYYEFNVPDSSATYSLTYNFDEQGLNEIQSDLFVNNPDQTDTVLGSFKKYFEDHYGSCEVHMGFSVWTVSSEKYGKVRINLSDESADLGTPGSPGKISLWIYPDKE